MIAEEKFHTSGDTDNTPTDRRWWDPLHHYPPPPFFYFQPHHVPQALWAAFFIFPTRVGYEVRDGKKVRISKKSGEII